MIGCASKLPYGLASLPFEPTGDGHWMVTGLQMIQQPKIAAIVKKHPEYFEHLPNRDAAILKCDLA